MRRRELLAARRKGSLAGIVGQPLHRFGQRRQRRLRVTGNIEIGVLPAAEILIIGFQDKGRALPRVISLAPGLVPGDERRTMRSLKWVSVPHRSFISERQDHVGLADHGAAKALIERMPRREIHAAGIVDDAALQRFGERDEVRHAGGRPRHPIADDDRVLRFDQHFSGLGDRAGIAPRRDHGREFRNAQASPDRGSDFPATRHRAR